MSRFFLLLVLPLLAVPLGCASSGAGLPPERATIRGLLSLDDEGTPLLEDCDSRRPVTLGSLTEGHLRYLRRRHGELTRRHREPVTAEVSGYLERMGRTLHLERAAPLWVAPGRCVDEDDGYLDYN
jgi:hypothetical protein